MSAASSFCALSPALSPLCCPPFAPSASFNSLAHFLLFPQSLSDVLPIILLLLFTVLLFSLLSSKKIKRNLADKSPRKNSKEKETLLRKGNGAKADVVLLPTIWLNARRHRSVSVPMPMLLFTPSVGFVDLRKKAMSVPSLMEGIGETDGRPSNWQRELQQIPSDLWFTRRRIEAGLREQQKQKAILENVQDQLLRSRLRHANWRNARSHSPPISSARTEETEGEVFIRQQRPNTSWERQTAEEPKKSEFGIRIGQLEQQLEHLQMLASQTLLSHFHQSPHPKTNRSEQWPNIQTELIKLRRNLTELRKETADEFAEFGNELTKRLAVTLARRTRRELAHLMAKRRVNVETEELRKRCALLEEQKTKFVELSFAAELRVDESEKRRAVIERVQSQIWTVLGLPAISAPESLPCAVQKAIDAEKHRWEAQKALMAEKVEAKEHKMREEHLAEANQASREMMRREAQWAGERAQHRREMERLRAELQETRKTAECREMELMGERTRADEAKREAHARVTRAEEEAATLMEAQRNALARAEAEIEAQRTQSNNLGAQRTYLEKEIERKDAELRKSHAKCEEALRESDELVQALQGAKTQYAKANSECSRLMAQLLKERNDAMEDQTAKGGQLAELQMRLASVIRQAEEADRTRAVNDAEVRQRMAEADAEFETLKVRLDQAEHRLRMERETRLADAQRQDKEWEEQERTIGKLELEKERLQQMLVKAEESAQHALGEAPQTDVWRQRVERLQQSLARAEADAATERRQTAEVMEERERRCRTELDHAKAEISRKNAELNKLRESEMQLEEHLQIAEACVKQAREMRDKLNAELDELSERSVAQNSSTEQLRTELNDAKDEMALLRKCNEEQKGRNSKLEAELVKVEKAYNREKEWRIKTEENLKKKESETHANDQKRLSEQREFQLTYERLTRIESARSYREEAWHAKCKHEEQIHESIGKWGEKVGIKTMPKRTDGIEALNQLLNQLWDKYECLEKRKERAEEENVALNGQLCSGRKRWKEHQNQLETQQQQINALQEKLTKLEREAQREKAEKDQLERQLRQWEETARREKAQTEAKLAEEHGKTLIRRETENKFISNSLEEIRNENLLLIQKWEEMEKLRIEGKDDGGGTTIAKPREKEAAEMAIIKAQLSRERTEKNRTNSELREVQQELMQSLQKAERLQTKLDREMRERAKERHATDILQKRETERTAAEAQMRVHLSTVNAQWRISVQSEENVRRALRESEATCRELDAQLRRAERESNAQKQHIEAMEMDRKRVEAVIRQTTLERNALTKSLDAMESENAELQRHCNALQTQVDRITESDKSAQKHLEEQQKRIHRLEKELTNERRRGAEELRKVGTRKNDGRVKMTDSPKAYIPHRPTMSRAHSQQQMGHITICENSGGRWH